MDKEKMDNLAKAKKGEYHTEVLHTIKATDAISDGGTEAAAEGLEGTWIKLNDLGMFAFIEKNDITVVQIHEGIMGCACERFTGSASIHVLCKHLIAIRKMIAEKKTPQLSISSADYRWVQAYLFELGWFTENRWLYPSLDAPTADNKTGTVQPEVVAELPPSRDRDGVDLPPGEDPEPAEPKTITRKCQFCGKVYTGTDVEQVKREKADHQTNCPKNPKNKKAKPPVTKEPAEPKEATTTKTPEKSVAKKPAKGTEVVPQNKKPAVVKQEMPTEAQFQTAAVGRILKNQGKIYRVSGKDVPDSAAVSNYAVASGVSTETVVLEQTTEYARATVRAHKGGRYTEGSVLVRKDALLEKILIDIAEKNPDWITGWSNCLPEFDLDRVIFIGDKRKILGLHIAGTLADKWIFASRDCETKAGRRAMIKILGSDWRESTEVDSEVDEMNTVAKGR